MRRMKTMAALMALTTLTACDNIGKSDAVRERADGAYRSAMSDYQAGRLPQAIKGLKKVCVSNPANASARFQLACLLQDSAKDYVGAFCAYREYLLQSPESEKAKLASDRLLVCEREMAKVLSEKYALRTTQDALREVQEGRAAKTKAETALAKVQAALDAANQQLESLRQENARLKDFMRDEADPEPATFRKDELAAAKALAEDDEPGVAGATDLAAAKKLVEEDGAESPPLLKQAPDAKEKRAQLETEKKVPAKKPAPLYPHESRPEEYVVQNGDTLYKIAIRFYGRASAWQAIRNANRAKISTDGRLRVGQKIVLPNIE